MSYTQGMSGSSNDKPVLPTPAPAYERPRITWREPYEPMSFGLSCAKQPGNRGQCGAGPLNT